MDDQLSADSWKEEVIDDLESRINLRLTNRDLLKALLCKYGTRTKRLINIVPDRVHGTLYYYDLGMDAFFHEVFILCGNVRKEEFDRFQLEFADKIIVIQQLIEEGDLEVLRATGKEIIFADLDELKV